MSSNTPNLGLLKKDPMVDGNETFNIETMLNENWDKVDEAVGQVRKELGNIDVDIPEASLTEKGIVQLSSATNGARENVAATEKAVKAVKDDIPTLNNTTNSTSTTQAATANAVKVAYDLAVTLQSNLNNIRDTYQPYLVTSTVGDAILITGTNLNNNLKTGFYMGSNLTNAPSPSWWYVQVIRHNSEYFVQNAYSLDTNTPSYMQRKKVNGTWTSWSQMIVNNVNDVTDGLLYQVPEQYPSVQAALNAMKKVNFGLRQIYVADGFENPGNIILNGFNNGSIEISGLGTSGGFKQAGDIRVENCQCNLALTNITLTSSSSIVDIQSPVYLFMHNIFKTVVGVYGIWLGKCRGELVWSTISNQTGYALRVFSGAHINLRSISGTNNAVCVETDGSIVHINNFNNWGGTVKGAQYNGGRIFVGNGGNVS